MNLSALECHPQVLDSEIQELRAAIELATVQALRTNDMQICDGSR